MIDSSGVDIGIHFLISLSVGAADEPTSRTPIKEGDIIEAFVMEQVKQ